MKTQYKNVLIGVGSLVLLSSLRRLFMNTRLSPVVEQQKIRGCDPEGCGYFGAPRGSRLHNGIDVITVKGQPIKAPIDGVIERYAFPYDGDLNYKGLVIRNSKYYIKMFYLEPTIERGTEVNSGDVIGISQDISEKWGDDMTTHVHVEVYLITNSGLKLINPTKLF